MIPVSIIVLAAVFILIAFRQIGGFRLAIWQAMLLGALLVLLAGQIGIQAAIKSINLEVIAFLFGMFVIGQAMEDSGYLSYLSYKIFRNAKSADRLVLTILLFFGLGSALLMNYTMAIIGTPVMIILARQHNLNVKLLLLALAFAVTTGSVVSPTGNPQNLLIAIHMENSFIVFFRYLFLPTMLSILAC
ncbi:MAG: SLC13 family permease [Candidatus Aenigmatarchaeota archaeon]